MILAKPGEPAPAVEVRVLDSGAENERPPETPEERLFAERLAADLARHLEATERAAGEAREGPVGIVLPFRPRE